VSWIRDDPAVEGKPAWGVVEMKYIAPVEPRHEASVGALGEGSDDLDSFRIVELTGVEQGVGSGSRQWIGVMVGIVVAITGLGFLWHGSGPPIHGPAQNTSKVAAAALATPRDLDGANETGGPALHDGDQPVVVIAPADGATVTSGVTMTGGVVVIYGAARRALGMIHASVSMGGLVLGSSDVDVQTIGPFAFRIPLFPPPFDAPVVLRMQAAPSSWGDGFEVSRDFHLDIPSAVGFWDASLTGMVDVGGRVQMVIRGYGPRSARTVDVAIRDARGHDVAKRSVRLALDADLPGAVGGRILGLGSFVAALWLPPGSADGLSLIATWRDAATGTRLHMETALTPVAGGSAGAWPRP
jgi:hypothetical protein